jgi:hypothetical protein
VEWGGLPFIQLQLFLLLPFLLLLFRRVSAGQGLECDSFAVAWHLRVSRELGNIVGDRPCIVETPLVQQLQDLLGDGGP